MQRKAEERLRLPTWLWLGVKIAGNGILGYFPERKFMYKIQKILQKQNAHKFQKSWKEVRRIWMYRRNRLTEDS